MTGGRERKHFPLRLDPRLYEVLQAWAADDLRSVNAQIEMLLIEQARRAGRWPKETAGRSGRGPSD